MPPTDVTRSDASDSAFPDPADRQLLDEARRQYREERAARAALDAVDELGAAADAFTAAYLRGEATDDAFLDVVQAAHRLLRGAQ